MSMTPEEKAVVQAAIELRSRIPGQDIHQRIALDEAVWQLIIRCQQCNAGGHVCPGDGNPIGHGDTDCGEHDEPRCSECGSTRFRTETGACADCGEHDEQPEAERPQWVARTWQDVRPGDRVRLPGTEHVAAVESAIALPWNMVQKVLPDGRKIMVPAKWREIKVRLRGRDDLLSMDPEKPIEIELTASELAAIEDLGGWHNRAGTERA